MPERFGQMRLLSKLVAFVLAGFLSGIAYAQTPTIATAAKPTFYALVAALGDQFVEVTEFQRTGSHLSPYQRRFSNVADNILNRVALHSLDQAIAKVDPTSRRIYLSLPAADMTRASSAQRGSLAVDRIIGEMRKVPQRADWDRIVIVTPAYRSFARNGMASKLQGFGIFIEPLCQAGCGPGSGSVSSPIGRSIGTAPLDGVDAVTATGAALKAQYFVAPFSYIEITVVDAKTLAIVDRQQRFEDIKLAEPVSSAPMTRAELQQYLSTRLVSMIELSVGAAVANSEIAARIGNVDLGPIKRIDSDDHKQ